MLEFRVSASRTGSEVFLYKEGAPGLPDLSVGTFCAKDAYTLAESQRNGLSNAVVNLRQIVDAMETQLKTMETK